MSGPWRTILGMAATATRRRTRLPAVERRRTIVDAALEVFAERGYSHSSVDEIADRAGITVAVIYRHFASKEELHRAVLEEQWQGMLAEQRARVFGAPPGIERLRAAYASYFEWFEAHPLALRFIFREASGPPAVVEAHEAVARDASDSIASYLLGGPARVDPSVRIVAEFLRGGTNTVARWWLDNPGLGRDEVVDRLVELTWSGLAPLGAEGRLMEALRRPRTRRPR